MGKGTYRANHCNISGRCMVICAKTAEPIDLPFLDGTKVALSSIVSGGANVPSWEDTLPPHGEYD